MNNFKELWENVIEEFGGYDKCKEMLSIPNIDFIMNAQGLREHMLQYRRANNIFETGDWVINTKTGALGDFIKYTDTKKGHKHCLVDIGLCDTALFCVKNIRHATDEEVAVGHRL